MSEPTPEPTPEPSGAQRPECGRHYVEPYTEPPPGIVPAGPAEPVAYRPGLGGVILDCTLPVGHGGEHGQAEET